MNTYIFLFLAFILSLIVSIILIPICKKTAFKFNVLDIPDKRKIHKEPVPYFGGIAIFFSFLLSMGFIFFFSSNLLNEQFTTIVIGVSLIFIVGLLDDIKSIRARHKFIGQLIVSIYVVYNGIFIKEITNPIGGGSIDLGILGPIISVFWIVSLTNAMNLIDGLDGLAAGVSSIAIIFMTGFSIYSGNFVFAVLMVSFLGGLLGFLVFNFPPAKIFMGDAGSLTIGFFLSIMCLMTDGKSPYAITILIPFMLLIIPIIDTLLAIIRRTKNKKNIFSADKEHIHHRILELSKSYRKTLYIIYIINFFFGLIATAAYFLPNEYRIILFFILAENILFGMYILHLFETRKKY
ncbi:MAG: undecaprenyl/decaprenyl-phosphate alpha-N-acetylglucosaminyl 1-phosphate transferase [Spirochaetia bacterium]|nr:undecaprenyl/decaprenyl-phosphate alpha-N-acetylglucosaminyl 1-phosphate transferase [Spirochaetia bacterium]